MAKPAALPVDTLPPIRDLDAELDHEIGYRFSLAGKVINIAASPGAAVLARFGRWRNGYGTEAECMIDVLRLITIPADREALAAAIEDSGITSAKLVEVCSNALGAVTSRPQ